MDPNSNSKLVYGGTSRLRKPILHFQNKFRLKTKLRVFRPDLLFIFINSLLVQVVTRHFSVFRHFFNQVTAGQLV